MGGEIYSSIVLNRSFSTSSLLDMKDKNYAP
jgi:hypothetical protein